MQEKGHVECTQLAGSQNIHWNDLEAHSKDLRAGSGSLAQRFPGTESESGARGVGDDGALRRGGSWAGKGVTGAKRGVSAPGP